MNNSLDGDNEKTLPNTSGPFYQPDRGHVETARWLGFFLLLLTLFSLTPAWRYLNLETAPGWARVVVLMTLLQAVYVVWMLAAPDWSTIRVLMLVFAASAVLYGMATAMALATPLDKPMPLDMGGIRDSAARWCGAMLLGTTLATYACGHIGTKWRRVMDWAAPGKR